MGFSVLWWRQLLLACFVSSCIDIVSASVLPRSTSSTSSTCNLNVQSNNGGRKVALLIDSSSSMYLTDPQNARLEAADLLTQWLVSASEVTATKTADEVTVIAFNDTAHLEYPLGDPAPATGAIDLIQAQGGTDIVAGVQMGISELTKDGSGTTEGRSSMIVFTDGEDYDTQSLVTAINNATAVGIRVSFGFMNTDPTSQYPASILSAVKASGGVYATITSSNSSSNFINYCILNGLTNSDNPSGDSNQLLAGLSTTHFITGNATAPIITYTSTDNEWVQFTITSISAGSLTASASYGGKVINTTITGTNSSAPGGMLVVTPTAGQINITISSTNNSKNNSVYLVSATSNHAISACTIGELDEVKPGWSKAEKYGVWVGVPVGVVLLIVLLFISCIMCKGSNRKDGGSGIRTPPIVAGGYGFLAHTEKSRSKSHDEKREVNISSMELVAQRSDKLPSKLELEGYGESFDIRVKNESLASGTPPPMTPNSIPPTTPTPLVAPKPTYGGSSGSGLIR